jgi:hypothetical protein
MAAVPETPRPTMAAVADAPGTAKLPTTALQPLPSKGRRPAKQKGSASSKKRQARAASKKQPMKGIVSKDVDNESRQDAQPDGDESASTDTQPISSTLPGAGLEPNTAPKQYNTWPTNNLHPGHTAGLARRYQTDISKVAAEKRAQKEAEAEAKQLLEEAENAELERKYMEAAQFKAYLDEK